MVPILNYLLDKYEAEGGDNRNRILRYGFPQKYTGGLPADCYLWWMMCVKMVPDTPGVTISATGKR